VLPEPERVYTVDLDFANSGDMSEVLTMTPKAGTTMTMKDLYWLNFGNSAQHLNLCGGDPAKYSWKGDPSAVDLSSVTAEATLVSTNSNVYPDLTVKMALLDSGAVSVKWNYRSLPTGWKEPWAVPDLVLAIDGTVAASGSLSTYLKLGASGEPLLTVMSNGVKVFELTGIILQ